MAAVTQLAKDWEDFYDKFNATQRVGIGNLPTQIYHSQEYQKKKVKKIVIGGVARCVYAAFDHDPTPTILTFGFEPQYNTIQAFNLHYIPISLRKKVLDYFIKSNNMRIKNKKPMIVDYVNMVKSFPELYGTVRRYKIQLIGIIENVPLIGFPHVAQEQSQFTSVYKEVKAAQR